MYSIFRNTLWGLAVLCLNFGCTDADHPVTRISGDIKNLGESTLTLKFQLFDKVSLTENISYIEIPIDSTGHFDYQIDTLTKPCYTLRAIYNSEFTKMILNPGDDIYVNVNYKEFDETIKYSGTGAEKNNYLAQRFLKYEDRSSRRKESDNLDLNFEEFLIETDRYVQERTAILNNAYRLLAKDKFYEYELSLIQSDLILINIAYLEKNGKEYNDEIAAIINEIGLEGQAQLDWGWHRNGIMKYVNTLNQGKTNLEKYEWAKTQLSNDPLRYYYMNGVATMVSDDSFSEILADMKNNNVEDEILGVLNKKYEEYQMLSSKFPNTDGEFVAFGSDLKKSSFLLTIQSDDPEVKSIKVYDSGIGGDSYVMAKRNEKGLFSIELPIYYSHDLNVSIKYDRYTILANPGEKLFIDHNLGLTQYYGDGAHENEVLNKYTKLINRRSHPFSKKADMYLPPKEVKKMFVDRYNKEVIEIERFFEDKNTPNAENWARYNAIIENYGSLLSFDDMRSYYAKKDSIELKELPFDFYDFKEDYLSLGSGFICSDFINDIIRSSYSAFNVSDQLGELEKSIEILNVGKSEFNEQTYDVFATMFIGNKIENKDFDFCDAVIDRYQAEMKTPWMRDDLMTKYEHEKKVFDGVIVPDGADLNQLAQSSGDSLLSNIVAKHKGKVIYVDTWATWCGPCIGEFKYAKDFHKGIQHDKVAMVYLAGKSNKNSWKAAIAEYELKGDHYLLTDEQYDDISAKFNATGFPNYAIIDQQGIIRNNNAPRPSIRQEKLNEGLIKQLNTM